MGHADRKVQDGSALPADQSAYRRASSTASRALPETPRRLPYRTLASVVDIATGHEEQTLRILRAFDPEIGGLDELRPRLDRAQHCVNTYVPAEERTQVRETPDKELLDTLGEQDRESLRLLAEGLDEHWSLDGLTTLVYGVPKVQAGLDMHAKAATPELKAAQRAFFALLYRLLVGHDTGPRLPTLLLAVGRDRVRELLGRA